MLKNKKAIIIKALVRILIAVLILLLIVFPACNKIRGVFDGQKILVDENGVPLALGEPDGDGIYKYDPTESSKEIWYKFDVGENKWKWTPYKDKNTIWWMDVSTTTIAGGESAGEEVWDEHIPIIRFLEKNNPNPNPP